MIAVGNPGDRANGFTLVELIVAMTMLTAGVLVLAAVMGGTKAVDRQAGNRQEMVALAESKFEDLRAAANLRSADTVQLVIGGSTTLSEVNYSDTVPGALGRQYIRRWAVAAGPAISRDVRVRVVPLAAGAPGNIDFLEFNSYVTLGQP